ncbi:MAG: saccharopine dehydrogenase C-terminal domain-containing protein [Nanoarchaeota archaeon]
MVDFVVLGATGMQGKITSKDLLENNYSILMCGRDKSRIEHLLKKYKKAKFQYFDARKINETAETIKESGANIAINCVEGDWNLNILKSCIKANANCIDLGSEIWMTKEQLNLDAELKKKGIISITGAGSVPDIGNVMLKYAAEKFNKINDIEVGFSWDSNIKKFVVPFSIQSIIEEFTDPAPIVESRHFIKKTPLSSIIEDYHRKIGKQKEFFVRHPETYTFYRYYKNKGVKNIRFYAGFPQHSFEKINSMIELGLGSKEPINYKGTQVIPVEFLTEVLKKLKIEKGYKEKENLWVRIKGIKNKSKKEILMECIVPTLKGWEDAGCNIDTGMPASIIAQMIKKEIIKEKGSFSPEGIVPPEPFFKELKKRKMIVLENGKRIN